MCCTSGCSNDEQSGKSRGGGHGADTTIFAFMKEYQAVILKMTPAYARGRRRAHRPAERAQPRRLGARDDVAGRPAPDGRILEARRPCALTRRRPRDRRPLSRRGPRGHGLVPHPARQRQHRAARLRALSGTSRGRTAEEPEAPGGHREHRRHRALARAHRSRRPASVPRARRIREEDLRHGRDGRSVRADARGLRTHPGTGFGVSLATPQRNISNRSTPCATPCARWS